MDDFRASEASIREVFDALVNFEEVRRGAPEPVDPGDDQAVYAVEVC